MAKKGKISELYDLDAIEEQQKRVIKHLDMVVEKINGVKPMKDLLQQTNKPSEIIASIEGISAAQQEQAKSTKLAAEALQVYNGQTAVLSNNVKDNIAKSIEYKSKLEDIATQLKKLKQDQELLNNVKGVSEKDKQDIKDRIAGLTEEQKQLKLVASELDRFTNSQIKQQQASATASGTIKELRAQLDNLRTVRDTTLTVGTKEFDEANVKIRELNDLIKQNESAGGDFRRNVGNYAGSLAKSFGLVADEISKLEKRNQELKSSFQNLSGGRTTIEGFKAGNTGGLDPKATAQLQSFTAELEQNEAAMQKLTQTNQIGFQVNKNQTVQVRQLEKAYIDLAQTEGVSKEFLQQFRSELGEAKDNVNDLRESLKLAASDTKQLDVLIGAAQAVAGAFGIFQGAAALAGQDNEELQKTLVKLNGVMTILNGLQAIQNELKKKDNIITITQTNLQKLYTFAVGSSTGAMKAFRIALLSTGIVGVVVLIGTLITAFKNLKEATTAAAKNQEALLDINKKAVESYGEEVTHLKLLNAEYSNTETTLKRRKEIEDELQKQYPTKFANLDKEVDKQAAIKSGINDITKALVLQAKVQAAQSLLVEKFQDLLKKQLDPTKAVSTWDAILAGITNFSAGANAAGLQLAGQAQKNIAKAQKEYEEYEKFIIGFVTNSNQELEKLGGDPKKPVVAAKNKKFFEETLKQSRDLQLEISKNEERAVIDRVNARKRALELDKAIIEGKRATDVANAKGDAQEIANINETARIAKEDSEKQSANDILKINTEFFKNLTENTKQGKEILVKEYEDIADKREENLDSKNDIKLKNLKLGYDREVQLLDQQFADGLIKQKEYDERKLDLQLKFQKDTLEEEIKYTKEVLRLAEIRALKSGDQGDIDKARKARLELKDLEIQLLKITTDATIDANNKKAASDKELHDKRLKDFEQLVNISKEVSGILTDFNAIAGEKEKNRLQTEIDLIEQKKLKDIEYANQTISNAERREQEISIIEKRAAAQKEVLEQKKRQAQERQAKFEKAATIANLITETALAVIRALGARPFTPANFAQAAIVGAIGAAKIAVAIATPVPKYRTGAGVNGRPLHKGGLGEVGHGQEEIVETPDGNLYKTKSTPEIWDMPKDTKIYPDQKTFINNYTKPVGITSNSKLLERITLKETLKMPVYRDLSVNNNDKTEVAVRRMEKSVVKAIKNIPQPNIKVANVISMKIRGGGGSINKVG